MPLVRKPGLAAPPADPLLDADRITPALASAQADERWAAARAAPAVAGIEQALAQALALEHDARVREAMVTSLARIGTPAAIDPLVAMIRSEQAALRTAALDALRFTPAVAQVVIPLVEDPDADVRLLGCDLVRSLPPAEANTILSGLLTREAHPNVCAAAIEVLAEVGGPEVLASLDSCARRFPDNEFLLFAIKTVSDRIRSSAASPRV